MLLEIRILDLVCENQADQLQIIWKNAKFDEKSECESDEKKWACKPGLRNTRFL